MVLAQWREGVDGVVCGKGTHRRGHRVRYCVRAVLARAAHSRLLLPSSHQQFCTPVTHSKEKVVQLCAKCLLHHLPAQQHPSNNETDYDTMKAELERVDFGSLTRYNHLQHGALFPGRSGSSRQQKQGFSLFDFNPHKGALGLNLQVGGSAALFLLLLLPI